VKSIAFAIGLVLVAGAGCGDDDDGSSGTSFTGDARAELVRLTVDGMADQGIGVDRGCVEELAAQLPDDDARALVEAYPDGDPELSESSRGIGSQLLTCADRADLVDALVGSLLATAPVSEDCIRPVLEALDVGQLAALLSPDPGQDSATADADELDRVVDQLIGCRPSTT
jgi:hypothetical protein